MVQNVGRLDAQVRVVLGAILIVSAVFFSNHFALVGLLFIATALGEWCVIYKLFNISSYKEVKSSFRCKCSGLTNCSGPLNLDTFQATFSNSAIF